MNRWIGYCVIAQLYYKELLWCYLTGLIMTSMKNVFMQYKIIFYIVFVTTWRSPKTLFTASGNLLHWFFEEAQNISLLQFFNHPVAICVIKFKVFYIENHYITRCSINKINFSSNYQKSMFPFLVLVTWNKVKIRNKEKMQKTFSLGHSKKLSLVRAKDVPKRVSNRCSSQCGFCIFQTEPNRYVPKRTSYVCTFSRPRIHWVAAMNPMFFDF